MLQIKNFSLQLEGETLTCRVLLVLPIYYKQKL